MKSVSLISCFQELSSLNYALRILFDASLSKLYIYTTVLASRNFENYVTQI